MTQNAQLGSISFGSWWCGAGNDPRTSPPMKGGEPTMRKGSYSEELLRNVRFLVARDEHQGDRRPELHLPSPHQDCSTIQRSSTYGGPRRSHRNPSPELGDEIPGSAWRTRSKRAVCRRTGSRGSPQFEHHRAVWLYLRQPWYHV